MGVFEGDRALLTDFRAGRREALTRVYLATVERVAELVACGFSLGDGVRVPPVRAAQQADVIQEVYLRAFSERARLSYDGISAFEPWLLTIAKNFMIDEGRKRGHVVPSGAASHEPEVLPVSPEEELDWRTLQQATRGWVSSQSPELQDFVRLRFTEERSQAEVASALGVTRRKVRTLEEQVLAGLKEFLGKSR